MPSDALATWKDELQKGLRALEARSLRRSLAEVHGVNLCSNDYLGLAEHPTLHEAAIDAVTDAPARSAAPAHACSPAKPRSGELWKRSLRSLRAPRKRCSSAAVTPRTWACWHRWSGKDDVVYSDVLNHASLIDGMRLSGARKVIYPHLDLDALEDALRDRKRARRGGK